ncbi:MAG: S1 RNA-binding domain-containing protein, partial [Comamonadaceae bacterium]|nr:S1 RNA-binding domain-containing protein [Comamonadaceae bacterium]
DLGVHQDGLVHVSQLANKFVADAREIVKTGQVVKVKVLEVDVPRKRISLTMRLDASAASHSQGAAARGERGRSPAGNRNAARQAQPQSAMQSAFAKLQGLKK